MNGAKPPTQVPHRQVRHVHFQWLRVVEDKREGRAETDKKEKPREVTRAVIFSGVRSGDGGSIWGLWETLNAERKKSEIFSYNGVLFIFDSLLNTEQKQFTVSNFIACHLQSVLLICDCPLFTEQKQFASPNLIEYHLQRVLFIFYFHLYTEQKRLALSNFIVYHLQSVLLIFVIIP